MSGFKAFAKFGEKREIKGLIFKVVAQGQHFNGDSNVSTLNTLIEKINRTRGASNYAIESLASFLSCDEPGKFYK